jgi:catechol 2,3-dioxygenase-like lactoylglutathione lyase family enzyme
VAIGVTDMERSLVFYRDVVGLRVRADQTKSLPSEAGGPPRSRRAVYLCFSEGPDESFIVLDRQLTVEPYGEAARLFQVGVHHFAFWLDDLDAAVDRARDAGFEIAHEPMNADSQSLGEPAGGEIRSAFISDPDGNLIQLDQRL